MQATLQSLWDQITLNLPQILAALSIFVGGWIVALIASALVRAALKRTDLDDRLAKVITGSEVSRGATERLAGRVAFYLVMLFVLVAVFDALNLSIVAGPLTALLTQVTEFAPRLFGAGALIALAWVLANGARKLVEGGLDGTQWGQKLTQGVSEDLQSGPPLGRSLGEAAYWLVFLLFLPAVLGALSLDGLLVPVQDLTGEIMAFLPNLIAAILLFGIGWLVARLVQRIVTNLLAASGVDGLSDRFGLSQALGQTKLSQLTGLIVHVLVLLPVIVSALGALGLEAITNPASGMLERMMGALPGLLAAGLLMGIAYLVGRVVANLVAKLLEGVGFDNILSRIGLSAQLEGAKAPSSVVGSLVLVAILLLASVEAARATGFDQLAGLVSDFAVFGGQVVLGLVIVGLGLFLANVAAEAIRGSGNRQAAPLATIAKIAILVLASAMGLRQMGLANEIINLAFGLLLGSIAVAAAIAFGIGGREAAKEQVEAWMRDIRES